MSGAPRLVLRARRLAGAPVVAVRAWVRGGARLESIPGQSLVTGRMLGEGTRQRDFRRIAAEAEARGMSLYGFGGVEIHGVACDALAADWELACAWVAELALDSVFPEDRCAWLRRQAQGELESLADQPDVLTGWSFLEQLYAPHALGRPIQGSAASLARLRPEDCAAFHAAGLSHGVVVTAAGEIAEDRVLARLGELFAGLAGPAADAPAPPAPAGSGEIRRIVRTRASDQAHLFLGHLTVPRAHPDYPALELLSVVLGAGSGLAGRIPNRIRERDGLAYTAVATAAAGAGLDPGRLVAYVGTSPPTVERAERAVVEELERLLAQGLEESEVAEARSYLLGRDPFRRETARQWADLLAEATIYGLPVDDPEWVAQSYRDLDRSAAEAAARRHFAPDQLRVTVGLPRS
ncbi:MAG TPA: insulinase family protein [Thermoanaerobaculia bacterium]|nr:insulinase family protein [Thermoanaerobaculia bacterium]